MAQNPQGGFADGLKKLSTLVTQLMHMPDADLQFLSSLQQNIIQYSRQQGSPAGPGGGPGIGGAPAGPAAGAGMPGMPQLPPQLMQMLMGGGGPGGPGGPPNAGMNPGGPIGPPDPDELRRVLSAGQQAQ